MIKTGDYCPCSFPKPSRHKQDRACCDPCWGCSMNIRKDRMRAHKERCQDYLAKLEKGIYVPNSGRRR